MSQGMSNCSQRTQLPGIPIARNPLLSALIIGASD
jgi:hypothetical protein